MYWAYLMCFSQIEGLHQSSQLDCENLEVRNRKGAESGLLLALNNSYPLAKTLCTLRFSNHASLASLVQNSRLGTTTALGFLPFLHQTRALSW